MILQLEDCINCLKTIHGEKYDFLFLFDHSNGHDHVATDALNANLIRKNFAGKQPKMKPSLMEDSSYLGPHHHNQKLKVGQTQTMIFQHTNTGPFYLNKAEQNNRNEKGISHQTQNDKMLKR